MQSKNSHGNVKKKTLIICLAVAINLVLGFCVILSVITAFQSAKQVSFSQNIENVRTLTNASANKVELEIFHHTDEIKKYAQYISHYNQTGMTEDEVCQFFADMDLEEENENCSWQLVDSTLNESVGANQGFPAIALGKELPESFVYKAQAYQELARIFMAAGEDTNGTVFYTNEFTDASKKLEKSFALTTTVQILSDADKNGIYETTPKTLMLLITSDYINGQLSNNNEVDTLSFFEYSNIIIDNYGNYVISNSSFQGTNFLDYIELYNENFTDEKKAALLDNLLEQDYSDTLYYQNNRGKDCAYTIVPVQNSEWHILSIVPLEAFHNSYDFNVYFASFGAFFVLMFLIDILFIAMINRQLRHRTKEAQAANEAKSQFLSSMSHDIRTPMNAIVGMTMIAGESLEQKEPDLAVLKDCINTIDLSGKHLLTLINDVLDISKIETGKVVFSPEDFSISKDVTEIFEIVEPQIEKKKLKLKTDISGITHEAIFTDKLRLNQIYLNILSNAIKYTNEGGTICVQLTEESAERESDKYCYVYTVSDTGIGMTPEFLKHIFDRFSRAVDTRVNSTQGTGLGMSICKQLVDYMGGTIEVQSKLNEGSTFTVKLELPVSKIATEMLVTEGNTDSLKEQTPVNDRPILALHVLVVEDNDVNWRVLSKLLERYQIFAERAVNGFLGAEEVKNAEKPYDIVLMDIQMPVMNGYESTKMIRAMEDKTRANTPIYAMTADTYAEDITKCKDAGMDGHLAKPIEIEKLLRILLEVSQKQQ